jgi:hypothetical protein
MSARSFHLGDILSVTTGLLVSPDHIGGVYRILDFMVGESLFTHQLPRAAEECRPALFTQHPDLATIVAPTLSGKEAVEAWLAEQVAHFGEYRDVLPLHPGAHVHIDPLTELAMMKPGAEIAVIQVDPS